MQTHEQIMSVYNCFMEELNRKEQFRKNIENGLNEYEYYSISNVLALESKSDIILKDTLLNMAEKSMKKTELYNFLDKENIEAMTVMIESEDFKYDLYFLNNNTNLIRDIVWKFWTPKQENEQLLNLLIKKAMKVYPEKTMETCVIIKKWHEKWELFIDKQMLYYKLEERLEEKDIKNPTTKI